MSRRTKRSLMSQKEKKMNSLKQMINSNSLTYSKGRKEDEEERLLRANAM